MTHKLRIAAAISVFLLVAGACGSKPEEAGRTTGKYGSDVDLDVGGTKKVGQQQAEPQQQTGGGGGGGGQPAPGQAPPAGGGGGGSDPDLSRKPIDGGSAGVNAFFFLNKVVPKLVIEIDAISGRSPTSETLNMIHQRFAPLVDKPGGFQILPTEVIPATSKTVWSTADIQGLEDKHRNTRNSRDLASIYLIFVNGEPDRPGPIGIAYSGSSAVVFIDQIRGAATPLVPAQAIENSTTVHEIGHLFAMVNQTYKSPRDHEDPEHRGHSKNQGSVMYWAVENVGVVNLLGGRTAPPTEFDKDDLADLADLKSGKLP